MPVTYLYSTEQNTRVSYYTVPVRK